MVSHVSTLGSHVFGGEGEGKSLTSFTDHCVLMERRVGEGDDVRNNMYIIDFCIHFLFSVCSASDGGGYSTKCRPQNRQLSRNNVITIEHKVNLLIGM